MKYAVVFTQDVFPPKPGHRRTYVFGATEPELDEITALVDQWNALPEAPVVEFMPLEMLVFRHNAEHDHDQHIGSSFMLKRLYRAKLCEAGQLIEYLRMLPEVGRGADEADEDEADEADERHQSRV